MTESLKKIVNHSLHALHQSKIVNSISELGTDAVNRSFEYDDQSDDSHDNEELLRMQIKQLKRQNAFLKGKIEQFKKGHHPHKPQLLKRQSLNCINILKKKQDPKLFSQQNSVNFIVKEIQSILKSLASLHKLQTDGKMWAINDSFLHQYESQGTSIIKIDKQYKQKLHKKLQMIPLSKEETRYGSLLQIFSEFYHIKMDEQKKMKQKISQYIERTIDISRKLIENANTKAYEKSLRSSCIYSMNPMDTQTSIANHDTSIIGSFIYQKARFGQNPEKHQLSYSTIDAQYVHRQMDC